MNQTDASKPPTAPFHIFAFFFALGALYHLVGFIDPMLVVPASRERHAVFVLINLVGSGLILWRPPWLIWPFGVLTVQQLYSHGWRAWEWWSRDHQIDWLSLGVMVVLPWLCVLLLQEQKHGLRSITKPTVASSEE